MEPPLGRRELISAAPSHCRSGRPAAAVDKSTTRRRRPWPRIPVYPAPASEPFPEFLGHHNHRMAAAPPLRCPRTTTCRSGASTGRASVSGSPSSGQTALPPTSSARWPQGCASLSRGSPVLERPSRAGTGQCGRHLLLHADLQRYQPGARSRSSRRVPGPESGSARAGARWRRLHRRPVVELSTKSQNGHCPPTGPA